MMAEAAVDSVDCLLCSEECVEPWTLGCEHRFCSCCLSEHWAPSLTGDCPKCNRRSSNDRLMEMDDLRQRQTSQTGETRKRPEQTPESPSDEPAVSQGAASEEEQRERLQFEINKLKERKELTEDVIKQYKSMLEHTQGQRLQCEAQIRAQFNLLHQLLILEEMDCLSKLKKELREKTRIIELELKNLQNELCSMTHRICSAEQQLQGQSTESSSLREHMESLVLTEKPEPQLRSGLLIDQARILGNLGYRVWKKMETKVNYSPVILNPNTADGELCLSEDLTSVRQRETPLEVPLNPERFTNYVSVLGRKGFSSRLNRWDVEVGDHPNWSIGVVSASAERRAKCEASPENGFWCLTYREDKYTDVNGETLDLSRYPEKICVELDCDTDRLNFYDAKYMTLIFSHRDYFTEPMFPYFSLGGEDQTMNIKICRHKPGGLNTGRV